MSEHPKTIEKDLARVDLWVPPEAPLEMPEQVLIREERLALGARLLSLLFPSNA
ncbi:hypothetical protein [Aliiruegeria lutimaris]|uniref:Uncharacterized protein n=1 Tax=Aliiruegeria lutimaris TaxID=571298 RepID=A0A1G9FIK9_9RHOB|nr:hypothetical protein [Aliiruegeria lutimaris]SDK88003.1 hypothetical protein SAMN04488026_105731 [Aliiruegeria lutimaris]